eukprot:TRINITY_DN15514_c1_g1_i1.p1 TRINITY_DN15514_c1_g1~~TRINITY_DN15514_c1_g1_i1.p1  ORF type:complete len:284 (-),score=84.65 TRINITY_DN15514_c1_g1_i1:58-909(-)
MGGDGGQVIDRATMVRTKGWGLTKSAGNRFAASLGEMSNYMQMISEDRGLGSLELHRTRMTTCFISQQELREPIVACKLGALYNKEAIISALLNRTLPEAVTHIKALKDVKQCTITWADAENEDGKRRMVCPITKEDLDTGSSKAIVIWPSGAIIGAKSLKEMKFKECPVTSKPFDAEKDVIPLAPNAEEFEKLLQRLPAKKRKASAASEAKMAEAVPAVPEEEEDDDAPAAKKKKAEKVDKTKESAVYKDLFTKGQDVEGWKTNRDAFGTPAYNRGSNVGGV